MTESKKDTTLIEKKISENKNPSKINDIVEKILDFNKQQEDKGIPSELACAAKVFDCKQIKTLTPKLMLQRLPIARAQVQAGNTSRNLPVAIRKII